MVVISAFIWSQYLAIIWVYVQKLSVCVICCLMLLLGEKKKCVLYYRIHIEFACSEAFLSLPSSCILILKLFFLSMMDAKCALFYFSIVFDNCFHTISQDIQLSTLILYLFYYNLLLYHLYDYWIKLYCIKYKLCQHVHLLWCV